MNGLFTHDRELLGLGAALVGMIAVQLYALAIYIRDQEFLENFMDRIAGPSLPTDQQVRRVVGSFRHKSLQANDQFFLTPLFRFMKATPRQVAQFGGNCSDRCRLIVVLLRLRAIGASKWALYSPNLIPCHAVVEVHTQQGKMVVDPLFGLWFPRQTEGYFGVEELRRHPDIIERRIEELSLSGHPDLLANPALYPLDRYTFTHARTINWDKSVLSRLLYRLLYSLVGGRVNQIVRPNWAEQPALMVIYAVLLIELVCIVGYLSR
jgi:hypothetical protein